MPVEGTRAKSDPIQEDLIALSAGDRRRGGRLLDALAQEWRPRIRRMLSNPSEDEVEELFDRAIHDLCFPNEEGKVRALASEAVDSPKAWRRQVLRNFLIDQMRRGGRRRHLEQGFARGESPAAEAERLRLERSVAAPEWVEPRATVAEPFVHPIEIDLERHSVRRVLPEVAIRRRVILWLCLGGDPSPWAGELANELRELDHETLVRIARAIAFPDDGVQDSLTLPRVRVPWPRDPEKQARESARKALERAIADVRKLLEAG